MTTQIGTTHLVNTTLAVTSATLQNRSRLLCAAAGLIAAALVGVSGFGGMVDEQVTRLLSRHLGTRFQPSGNVILVSIDDETLQRMEPKAGGWPWPRSHLARLVDACGGAGGVGFNLLLSEPDRSGPEQDQQLAQAFRRHGRVILAAAFREKSAGNAVSPRPAGLERSFIRTGSRPAGSPDEGGVELSLLPLPLFLESANRVGLVDLLATGSGTATSYSYVVPTEHGTLPSLAVAAWLARTSAPPLTRSRPSPYAPVVRFRPGERNDLVFYQEPFTRISALRLLEQEGEPLQRGWADGRIVLIGVESRAPGEFLGMASMGGHSALELHATALSNWLQNIRLHTMPLQGAWLVCGLFAIFPALFWSAPIRQTWILGGVLLAGYHLLMAGSFHLIPLRLPWTAPIIAFAVAGIYRLSEMARREHAARSRLEEVLNMRRMLSNTLLHDLSAPLNIMIMSINSVLPEQPARSKTRQRLENAVAEGNRLSELLRTLLEIQRMESGRMILQPRPVRWSQLAAETSNRLLPRAAARDLRLTVSHEQPDLEIQADPEMLGRVLVNLLDNAMKHAPPGSTIACKSLVNHPEPGWFTCRLLNRGPIIDATAQERIFQPFIQDHPSGGRAASQGFGLGLAFCKLAVMAHGGRIRCFSPVPEWQEGAGFEFSMPLKPPPAL